MCFIKNLQCYKMAQNSLCIASSEMLISAKLLSVVFFKEQSTCLSIFSSKLNPSTMVKMQVKISRHSIEY